MGSYLSEPVTEKISNDESNEKLNCGASSMQGWRVSQEDAHNCILDFDNDTSFFAVYDGHGGHEVALYCSQELPSFLKNLPLYKVGQLKDALETAFLQFDATIATSEVIEKLKKLAGDREAQCSDDDDDDEEEENVKNLYEEAHMPIEEVMQKYSLTNQTIKSIQTAKETSACSESKSKVSDVGCSSSSGAGDNPCSSNTFHSESVTTSETLEISGDIVSSSSSVKFEEISSSTSGSDIKEVKETKSTNNEAVTSETNDKQMPDSSDDIQKAKESKSPKETTSTTSNLNGTVESSETNEVTVKSVGSSSSLSQENGEIVTKKGKGKALTKTKGVAQPKVNTRPKRNATQLYNSLLQHDSDEEEDSEDEEDTSFVGPIESSDDDDDNADEPSKSDESSDDEECEEEEEDEDDDEANMEFVNNMSDEPGSESGCTAVVALLRGKELYVANAGDSRCIVCRNGKAIDMSYDHKPEDEPERARVVKAGGRVTYDGRVNGGLNLSRAIGDHAYKQNKELSDREQMITALPDIVTLTINPDEDEFMVLACDGIWNFMSSQEVVDFVRPRLKEGKEKVSVICEEMFDHCLAPNTYCDGTGCDNMTAIIVQFKNYNATNNNDSTLKRSAPEDANGDSEQCKKLKTDDKNGEHNNDADGGICQEMEGAN